MIPDQRERAAEAVRLRMAQLDLTASELARNAGVDVTTVRRLLHGSHWPNLDTRERVNAALGWPPGELARRATMDLESRLEVFETLDLLREVARRVRQSGI